MLKQPGDTAKGGGLSDPEVAVAGLVRVASPAVVVAAACAGTRVLSFGLSVHSFPVAGAVVPPVRRVRPVVSMPAETAVVAVGVALKRLGVVFVKGIVVAVCSVTTNVDVFVRVEVAFTVEVLVSIVSQSCRVPVAVRSHAAVELEPHLLGTGLAFVCLANGVDVVVGDFPRAVLVWPVDGERAGGPRFHVPARPPADLGDHRPAGRAVAELPVKVAEHLDLFARGLDGVDAVLQKDVGAGFLVVVPDFQARNTGSDDHVAFLVLGVKARGVLLGAFDVLGGEVWAKNGGKRR